MEAIIVIGAGFVFTLGFLSGRISRTSEVSTELEKAALKAQRANRDAGRLARRIHKQRLMIRRLRTEINLLNSLVPAELKLLNDMFPPKTTRKTDVNSTSVPVQPNLPH